MLECLECGENEILAEDAVVSFEKREELVKEKKKIERELKRKAN